MGKLLLTLLALVSFQTVLCQAPGSGYALDFGAAGDYVSIPNNAALNPTTALTLEAWIKADSWSVNSWGNVILSKDGWGSGEAGYTLRCGANGTLSFMFGTTTSWKEVLSTPQMALSTWYHVAGTFDGTQLKIYINGILSGTGTYSGVMLASTYALSIGRITYTAGGTRNFDGQIDEVKVWTTALTQATIQDYMTKKVTASHPNFANLAGYWKLDEGTGATTADSGPNNLTGTRTGTTWGLSAAAIGDENAVLYGAPATAILVNADGSSFSAQINSGNPTGLHVYAVNQSPNTLVENISGSLETTRYFGIFPVGGTNPSYTATYSYTGVPTLDASPQEQDIRITARTNNSGTLWSRINNQFQLDTLANSVFRCGLTGRREFAAGFDSVRYDVSNSTICQGDTLQYFGQMITSSGLYTNVTTAPNGCDSTIGVQVSVTQGVLGSDSATICSGDSVLFEQQVLTSTGTYTGVFTAANGCDSTVTFNLTVTPPMTSSSSATICNGDVFTLGAQSLTQAGTYNETFSAVNGCDSLVVLTLSVTQLDTSVQLTGNTLLANLFATSYQWLVCDNGYFAIPGQTGQSFSPGSNGSYAVIVSDGVCSDTSGCHFVLAIGIDEGGQALIHVSPNPATSMVRLERKDGAALGIVQLLTVEGKRVLLENWSMKHACELDLERVPKGLYFLQIQVDGHSHVLKVVKE